MMRLNDIFHAKIPDSLKQMPGTLYVEGKPVRELPASMKPENKKTWAERGKERRESILRQLPDAFTMKDIVVLCATKATAEGLIRRMRQNGLITSTKTGYRKKKAGT